MLKIHKKPPYHFNNEFCCHLAGPPHSQTSLLCKWALVCVVVQWVVNIQLPKEFDFVWNHNIGIFLKAGDLKQLAALCQSGFPDTAEAQWQVRAVTAGWLQWQLRGQILQPRASPAHCSCRMGCAPSTHREQLPLCLNPTLKWQEHSHKIQAERGNVSAVRNKVQL